MKGLRLFDSMYRKLLLAALALFLFGLGVSTSLNLYATRQVLHTELAKRAETLLRSVQEKCRYAVTIIDATTGETYIDRRSLDEIAADIRRNEPDVVRLEIVDRGGRILSSLDPAGRDGQQAPAIRDILDCPGDPVRQHINAGSDRLEAAGAICIRGYRWGTAFIAFSLEPLRRELRRLGLKSFAAGAGLTLFGLLLSLPLLHALVRPIKELSRHAVEIGRGNLDQHIEVKGRDEIGRLADAFRTMAVALRRTLADLDQRMAELRRSQARLRMSEKTYRDIVDNAFEGIFQVQPDGTPISVNPAMARMLGYADAAALRHAAPSLTALLVDPSQRGALRRALRVRGRISGFETRLRTRGGGTVVCELAARVVPGEGGGPALIEGSVFDVTERIERERAERESAAARAASEAKSSFLSNMSHEIRTPMNAVIGFANLALQTGSSPRQRDYLRRIVAAAEALLRIINDILDFSKMEAGRLTMEAIELDLEEVLIHAIAAVELQAEENGLALLVDLDPAMPMRLIGDPLRLGQVLLNLLGNAVKFTDQGTVVLRLRVRPLDTGRARLDGSVTDTGPGLTEAETARLFESFSQADDSTTRRHGGTGLGLAICRNLVELMDGAIDVRSEPGRGSTFRFHVMLGLAAPAGDGPADVPAGAPRVLILDANPDGRMLLARYLANAGYRAAAYADADGLLAAPDGAPAAAVLIDAQLPVDSIAALCRRIKARADRSRVCCLLVCGGLLQAELERSGWPAGLDGFIGKPVLPRSLREQLAARLGPGTATPGAPGRERGQSCATPGSGSTRLLPAGGPDEDPAVPVMPTDATATGGPALRGPAPDLDDIGGLIRALDRALELDARRALRLAEALDEVLGRTGWHAGFRRVHRLVRELDTDQARESLAKLAETIGVPLP